MYKLTNSAQKVIKIANDIAIELGHSYVGTEHLLYGLIKEGTGVASKVLQNQGITSEQVLYKIEELVGRESFPIVGTIGFTPRTKSVIENAFKESKKISSDYIGTEHILIGIMRESDSIAARIMIELAVDLQKTYNEIVKVFKDDLEENDKNKIGKEKNEKQGYSATQALNQYGVDLTKQVIDGKIDPIIGRKEEIERVIQILSRRTKNNPCLIGESGVGKTAIIEGLAEKIVEGDVPEMLKNKRVVSLDISSMVAGAKYRGDFEDRIKKVLNEVKKVGNIILFVDEMHTIVGAGAAEGAIDAANILKPLLARGEIQLIGATTLNEYRKYIEKDAALERRFSLVKIEEPTIDDAIQILKGLRDKYEAHHNVKITDEAIQTAVTFSNRYIADRFLPDKAIDLIDEAASSAKMKMYTEPDNIKKMQEELAKVSKEKEEAINMQDFEKAATLRDEENRKKEILENEEKRWKNKNNKDIRIISEDDIAEVIAKWTGIPVKKITQSEHEKLNNLEEVLHKRIVGQDDAVTIVSRAIRRGRLGLKDINKPIGSFIFLGPTGVGKTELSKAVAEVLFGNEKSMIRVDMSEYMEAHSISKLIGSPPGYVGFDEAGQLTEKVRRNPYSVILFDEIEKAHSDVMNILLQILDDGRLTDATGRTVDFKNCIIIMTSNVGARLITEQKTLGFASTNNVEILEKEEYEKVKKEVLSELKREFKPEFLNRIDEIIVFHKLNNFEIQEIVGIMLNQVKERMKEKNIKIEIDEDVKKYIVDKGVDRTFGARPLKRAIQNIIEDKLADEILNGKLKEGENISINEENGEIKFKKM